jgi:hypothetical protein
VKGLQQKKVKKMKQHKDKLVQVSAQMQKNITEFEEKRKVKVLKMRSAFFQRVSSFYQEKRDKFLVGKDVFQKGLAQTQGKKVTLL